MRSASNQSAPQPGWAPGAAGDPVPVFVINGVRTSDGPRPGVKHVPPDEAAALIAARRWLATSPRKTGTAELGN